MDINQQQQPVDWMGVLKSLGSTGGWTEKRDWLGPDFQAAMGGMSKAVNPDGITGNVGEAFKNYVQGIEMRKAYNKQLQDMRDFLKLLPALLSGQQPQGELPYAGGGQLAQAPYVNQLTASNDWLKEYSNPTGTLRR
jgi:hypothetical protein